MLGSTVAFGAAFTVVIPPRTALYWYVFPLFGIAVPYVVEVRRELTPRWWLTFAAAGVVSPIALALDWAFSGHILWNVLLLGHVARTPARNTAWLPLFGASLVHLFALKAATQTGRDLVGGMLSAALAGASSLFPAHETVVSLAAPIDNSHAFAAPMSRTTQGEGPSAGSTSDVASTP